MPLCDTYTAVVIYKKMDHEDIFYLFTAHYNFNKTNFQCLSHLIIVVKTRDNFIFSLQCIVKLGICQIHIGVYIEKI